MGFFHSDRYPVGPEDIEEIIGYLIRSIERYDDRIGPVHGFDRLHQAVYRTENVDRVLRIAPSGPSIDLDLQFREGDDKERGVDDTIHQFT